MADILILDPSEGAMEKYKTMLGNMEKEYNILYTTYPEQAMELLSEREIAVVLTENDMGILNAVELSEMLGVMHPEIVQLLMTEVNEIPKVLTTLNNANIFEILLKPFKFAEDMEEPLRRAMQEYEQRISQADTTSHSKEQIYNYDMEYDRLRQERFKRSRDYSSLYTALGGIVEGNVDTWNISAEVSGQDRLRLKEFIQQIVKEYVDVFIFGDRSFEELRSKLLANYEQGAHECGFRFENRCETQISGRKAEELYFAVFLMEHLCRSTLLKYRIGVALDTASHFYVIRFYCDPQDGAIQGNLVYKENVECIRTVMHEITEYCLKKLYTKSIKGYKGNPYVAVVTVLME